jgi:hypothetical protein
MTGLAWPRWYCIAASAPHGLHEDAAEAVHDALLILCPITRLPPWLPSPKPTRGAGTLGRGHNGAQPLQGPVVRSMLPLKERRCLRRGNPRFFMLSCRR